jgi:hypothetical protein
VLRLFKNNLTPDNTSVLADFTEADFTGYSAITLTGGSWTTTQGNPSTGAYAQQTFSSSAAQAVQTIYGYYITRTSTGRVWYYERFATARTIQGATDTIKVTPNVKYKDSSD